MFDTLMAYLLAPWHLRQMPSATPEDKIARAAWCRDHCTSFAGRWMIIAVVMLFVQLSPLGFLFIWGGWPILALGFLVSFCMGIAHLVAQIVSQKKAGPPRIDEPVEFPRDEE